MGLAREIAREALMAALTQDVAIDDALSCAVSARAQAGDVSESVLRKSASHARAIVCYGQATAGPVLTAADQCLLEGGDEEDVRRLLLEVNLQDALAARSASNTARTRQLFQASFAETFYAAAGHSGDAPVPSPAEFALALVDASPDCIKIVSLDGRLLFMSENGRCVLEIDDFQAFAGSPWANLWPEAERPKILNALASAGAGVSVTFYGRAPTAKGAVKDWEVRVSPIRTDAGGVCAVLAVSRELPPAHAAA